MSVDNKEKIIITGANGTIGQILQGGLKDYQISSLDLPKGDMRLYSTISSIASDHSALIHLAWDTVTDNALSRTINPENAQMFNNAYKAALEHGIKTVIMASSIHADRFDGWQGSDYLSPYRTPNPDSPYGSHKVFMESLGRYYASEGLGVICVRFGRLRVDDFISHDDTSEIPVFLSRRDAVTLIRTILASEIKPGSFTILYAVSNNSLKVHDLSNPFGWVPQDRVEDFLK